MVATASLERRHLGSGLGQPCYRESEETRVVSCHTAVVMVVGDLDAALLPEFQLLLDRALAISYHSVVIDLSLVAFLSLEAASALGPAQERASGNRLELSVVAGSRAVERALEITGMDALVRTDTVDTPAPLALPS
ncbi:STAS domain-containing protein [Rhodococcus sp. NPDC055112]